MKSLFVVPVSLKGDSSQAGRFGNGMLLLKRYKFVEHILTYKSTRFPNPRKTHMNDVFNKQARLILRVLSINVQAKGCEDLAASGKELELFLEPIVGARICISFEGG